MKHRIMNKLRIVLADDHGVLRDGLTLLINAQPDMEVVACARGGREAVQLAEQWSPHVLVLDISMPDLGGAEAAEQIRQRCPHVRILAPTRYADQGHPRPLPNPGSNCHLPKRTARESFTQAHPRRPGSANFRPGHRAGGRWGCATAASRGRWPCRTRPSSR